MVAIGFVSLLLAASAVAIPTSERVAPPRSRLLKPFTGAVSPARPLAAAHGPSPENQISYNTAWGGPVYTLPAGSVKTVRGTIVIPSINIPAGGNSASTYWSSAWVGIDGASCQADDTIWQTGFYFTIQGTTRTVTPWYTYLSDGNIHETWPSGSVSFKPGDSATLTIMANSKNSGTATIKNNSSGQTLTATVTNEAIPLCMQDAEWIVEDFAPQNPQAYPLANYGTVRFTSTAVVLTNGSTIGAGGAVLNDIVDASGNVITTTALNSDGSVSISYV